MMTEKITCDLCGSNDARVETTIHGEIIVICKNCDVIGGIDYLSNDDSSKAKKRADCVYYKHDGSCNHGRFPAVKCNPFQCIYRDMNTLLDKSHSMNDISMDDQEMTPDEVRNILERIMDDG